MENKKVNYGMENGIKIDADSFGESLLMCAVQAEELCGYIDDRVKRLATTAFIPYVSAMEQYESVIEEIGVKAEIIELYKVFTSWVKCLDIKQKRLVKAYFVTCTKQTCYVLTNGKYRKDRHILPIIRSFLRYADLVGNFDVKSLINNRFVRNTYNNVVHRNRATNKYKSMRVYKGRNRHDHSTNEGCNCGRVSH